MLQFKHFICILFSALVLCSVNSFAQTSKTDSSKTTILKKKNPKTATILSLALPGSGQIYNGKYWKAPIAWAGLIGLAYLAIDQQTRYKASNDSLENYNTTPGNGWNPKIDAISDNKILQFSSDADFYRRNRDFSWLGFGALYIYQVIDACVDAHLSEFDMSDNITMNVSPYIKGGLSNYHSGVALTFSLKK